MAMPDYDPKLTVLRFNAAINEGDADALAALMTDDHLFVDSEGSRTRGRETMRSGWQGFFSSFPDYRNVIDAVGSRTDAVYLLGHSECSLPALSGPALWRAIVRDGLVAEWRVYEDNAATRRELGLRSEGLFE